MAFIKTFRVTHCISLPAIFNLENRHIIENDTLKAIFHYTCTWACTILNLYTPLDLLVKLVSFYKNKLKLAVVRMMNRGFCLATAEQ